MIATILTTVVGALCVAAVLALIKSRWLYVIAPKLYLNTPISDGQIVSLTIFNAGLTSEEDVAISFRPACKFELIATSKSTLIIKGKTISVPKLSRLESITVLLLIEGKAFDPVDIESVESKATKGKVVEKKEKATAAWESIVVLPIVLLVLLLPFAFGTVIGADMKVSAFQYVTDKFELVGDSKQLAGFKVVLREKYAQGKLEGALKKSLIDIDVKEVIRRGDVLTLIVDLTNNTDAPLIAEGNLASSAGDRGSVSFWDSRTAALAIAPNEKQSVKIKVFLPESTKIKIVEGSFVFKNLSGESANISQIMEFK